MSTVSVRDLPTNPARSSLAVLPTNCPALSSLAALPTNCLALSILAVLPTNCLALSILAVLPTNCLARSIQAFPPAFQLFLSWPSRPRVSALALPGGRRQGDSAQEAGGEGRYLSRHGVLRRPGGHPSVRARRQLSRDADLLLLCQQRRPPIRTGAPVAVRQADASKGKRRASQPRAGNPTTTRASRRHGRARRGGHPRGAA